MKKFAIGADIGGSHISCAVIDMEKESIIPGSISLVEVNNQASADEILNNWVRALENSISNIRIEQLFGIGFAMPGPFDYEKGIALFERVAKYESLYNVNVAKYITETLGLKKDIHIRFMNDATSFAVGEAWIGKAAGYKKSISITLGTGFGSAFIESGLPVLERNDVPVMGCVWHLPYKDGIADEYFSTRWFIKRFVEKTGNVLTGVKEIAEQAIIGNTEAKNLFKEFGQNLAEFLGPWIKKFETEILVIGGNMAGAYNVFGSTFKSTLENQDINITICLSELKEDAAIIGSAKLLDEKFWIKIKPLLSKM
jgi:glucokinase